MTINGAIDNLIISGIASYCTWEEIPALIAIAGKKSIKEYYQLFGETYPQRSFILCRGIDVIALSAKWSYFYVRFIIKGPAPGYLLSRILTDIKWTFSYVRAMKRIFEKNCSSAERKKIESILFTSPKYAYKYFFYCARDNLPPEGEKMIFTSSRYTYKYLMIKSGHALLPADKERILFDIPEYACGYANDHERRLPPDLEGIAIAKSKYGRCARIYIKYVMNCTRVKELEEWIIQNPRAAICYAKYVLGEWPELRQKIMNSPKYCYRYAKSVLRERWKEAEPVILTSPKYSYLYCKRVLKSPWPEAEEILSTDPYYANTYVREMLNHCLSGKDNLWKAIFSTTKTALNYFLYAYNKLETPEEKEALKKTIEYIVEASPKYSYLYLHDHCRIDGHDISKEVCETLISSIIKCPRMACIFAYYENNKGRLSDETEDLIMSRNTLWAHIYARHMIKNVWPEIEVKIWRNGSLKSKIIRGATRMVSKIVYPFKRQKFSIIDSRFLTHHFTAHSELYGAEDIPIEEYIPKYFEY